MYVLGRSIVLLLTWAVLSESGAPLTATVATTYLQKHAALDKTDAAAVFDLAQWAEQNKLPDEAAKMYRRAFQLDRANDTAYARLSHIRDRHRLPEDTDRQAKLRKEFEGFNLHVSPHFLVVYNTDKPWAINRAVLLETTHRLFYQNFRKADQRPLPLEQRMVCVLFNTHSQFTAYAKRVDKADLGWSGGYYSTRSNRIAFYHDRDNPVFKDANTKIKQLQQQIAQLNKQIAESRRNPALVSQYQRQLQTARRQQRWYENRLKAIAKIGNSAKTTHEATHQLSFNSDLMSRRTRYPFWMAEGMATNFEVHDPSKLFGPYYDNPNRKKRLIDARDYGRLMPLEKFITLTDLPNDKDQIGDLYAQAWGFYQFLHRRKHMEMRKYLASLMDQPPGKASTEQHRKAFEDAFGNVKTLDNHWQRHLKAIR